MNKKIVETIKSSSNLNKIYANIICGINNRLTVYKMREKDRLDGVKKLELIKVGQHVSNIMMFAYYYLLVILL
jgi:hypothetical protein